VRNIRPAVKNTISRALFERGWSDADLATATGFSRSRINRVKNGRARPTVRDALLIGQALGLTVDGLFSALKPAEVPA